ncbi:related to Nuclear mRNA export protein SAC3 [Zygosaccharomyces bailii]|nr:related to Nuclear mRNA export protein SAC3 [Zygosaccharomyces bailii]
MNIPFGATASASGFNFFDGQKTVHHSSGNKSNEFTKIGDKKTAGDSGQLNRSGKHQEKHTFRHSDRGRNAGKDTGLRKSKLAHISASENSRIGSLVASPQQFGFHKMSHKSRPVPRFLINQQPQLKRKEFVQDPWDAANQQKMLQLEANIDDFSELYETLRKMRDVERKMMESKHLVDKADSAKDLTEAINFQGTCQDMCPVFERARRNVEYTVYSYEKNHHEDKKAARDKALKVFSRPAAAAAPPLPSDVRPPHILVKTLDYIVDNLLTTLPQSEGFLWDRMRSIRQDFTYQNYSGPEAIDCNERIVRIHLLIVHLMAKRKAEYSLQQELEQLHKSLITLSEIYDEVRASGGSCPNEAEFRAYALLSKIRDPEYDKSIEKLPSSIFQNDLVQQALCFRRLVSNSSYVNRGVIRTENCLNFYQRFFQLIATQRVPFLMCSFLELYVNEVRFYAFKALSYSLNKKHKPIPVPYFMENFLFNDEEELFDFCKYYSIEVSPDGVELKTLPNNSHKLPERQPMRQTYLRCVDNMLQDSTFSSIVNSGKLNVDTIPAPGSNSLTPNNVSEVVEGLEHGSEQEADAGEMEMEMEEDRVIEMGKDAQQKNITDNQIWQRDVMKPTFPYHSSHIPPVTSLSRSTEPPSSQTALQFEPTNKSASTQTAGFQVQQLPLKNDDINLPTQQMPLYVTSNQINPENEKLKEQPLIDSSKAKMEPKKIIEKQKDLIKEQQELEKREAASALTNQVVEEVVHKQAVAAVKEALQKGKERQVKIEELADVLYHAFIHEKLYLMYLKSKAQTHYANKLRSKLFSKWRDHYLSQKRRKQDEQKKKEDIQRVEKQLGVPTFKNSFSTTPHNDDSGNNSFFFSNTRKQDITFSPVNNEVNKFDVQANKETEIWEPFPIRELYCKKINDKFSFLDSPNVADIFIYGNHWDSLCGNWLLKKFGLTCSDKPHNISNDYLLMNLRCIGKYYNPSMFTNVQLLVFNTGVTDPNIFDLELKLQQDGEELIKLITGISLNTNICFSLLVVYWESAETPLAESVVSKCLKLNRICKGFSSVLEQIEVVNINSHMPHKVLEKGLIEIANNYEPKLTDRGRYNRNLRERRSTQVDSHLLTTSAIDEKMRRMHEYEEKKLHRMQDERNTYAHLQSHIAASPKLKKRKLPVLLSKKREDRFETPQTRRTRSSSSPAMFSHLAVKLGRSARLGNFNLAPATPSHSTNVPIAITDSHETPPFPAEQLELQEPALFQTPINSTPNAIRQPAEDSEASHSISGDATTPPVAKGIPSNIMELKNLIESVRNKVNGSMIP